MRWRTIAVALLMATAAPGCADRKGSQDADADADGENGSASEGSSSSTGGGHGSAPFCDDLPGGGEGIDDRSPPKVMWLTPQDGDVIKGETTMWRVEAIVEDDGCLQSFSFYMDDVLVGEREFGEPAFDIGPTAAGEYSVTLSVVDGAGRMQALGPRTMSVEAF